MTLPNIFHDENLVSNPFFPTCDKRQKGFGNVRKEM